MKIFNAEQIRALDAYTISQEPIASVDLMERAARVCHGKIIKKIKPSQRVMVLCGPGNNGGDGLVICKYLLQNQFNAFAVLPDLGRERSEDAQYHYLQLLQAYPEKIIEVKDEESLLALFGEENTLVVEALFGSGLNKPLSGFAAELVHCVNAHASVIFSVDMPAGLYTDKAVDKDDAVIEADVTFTFQHPKLAMMMAENARFVGHFEVLNIGLHPKAIEQMPADYFFVEKALITSLLKKRVKHAHKGMYGHALLLAGSKGKSGAALLAAKACLKSGAGLLTVHGVKETLAANLITLPEAMSSEDPHPAHISDIAHLEKYTAVGIGPGIGTQDDTAAVLKKLLHYYNGPLVLDADALNILSENKTWLNFLPPNSILTPHPKEFERLSEKHSNSYERLSALRLFAMRHKSIVILKGAYSAIAMPDGHVFFNSSGNAGMAKGGSGDVLTGMILGLLARGYNAPQAALIGTYVHGYAADLLAKKTSLESMLASEVIDKIGRAFLKISA
jgi:NAD(P)H-hydrate epimerase